MNIKKTLIAGATSVIMLAAAVVPSFASSGVAGTWAVFDRGPGGWAGGTLNQDFTANGAGGFAFKAPDGSQEVASINAVSWSFIDASTISLCVNVTGKQGPVFPIGVTILQCFPLVVSGPGAPVQSLFEPDVFTQVMLK